MKYDSERDDMLDVFVFPHFKGKRQNGMMDYIKATCCP